MSIELTIDGRAVSVPAGSTLLEAADLAGVYVPRLCAHPGLATRGHCGVCAVEREGIGVFRACETEALPDMNVVTDSAAVRGARAEALNRLLVDHPHVCLTCDLNEGCSRTQCSYDTPPGERCCAKFGTCEFQKVAGFIGIPADAPRYRQRGLPAVDEGLYAREPDLCIGCLRCEDACRDLGEAGAVAHVTLGGALLARPAQGETMKEAGCVFCGACVHVCPTGALLAKKDEKARRWLEKTRAKLALRDVPEPPRSALALDAETVESVPAAEGVYQLFDAAGGVLKIKGATDLRGALLEELQQAEAASFTYEQDPMYTSRESQLIQAYLAEHGRMPGGDELDDLFLGEHALHESRSVM